MNTFTSTKRLARAGIAAALALSTCLIANYAAAEAPTKSVTVSFADLDLSKTAGAQTLYKRIKGAARRVCGTKDRYTQESWRKCIEDAIANAVAQVDRPSLTALHKEEANRGARS
jgi:UrcA family protein